MDEKPQKCSLVVFSGDMDKVMAAFTIAVTAASMGMETTMFFTFWGMKAIQKGTPTGKGFFGKMLGVMNRGGIDRIGPSRFNFGGLGRRMFKKMMRDKGAAPLSKLLEMAINLNVKLLACTTSMEIMEITEDDLIPEVAAVVGAATFILEAKESQIQMFI